MATLDPGQIAAFHRDGFTIARRFFDTEEVDLLRRAALADRELDKRAFGRADGEGGTVRLSVWNQPGDNIYGMFARCRRVVDSMEKLLGGEVYHYHSKMILKDPRVGGAWAWHQDYGYWYYNGALFPQMASMSVAVDAATRENGCMQVLTGSQAMGRVDHVRTGEQAGADQERVAEACQRLPLVYCEMEPGDALFFHCNLLHRSDQNGSKDPRWSLICCYNAAANDPYKESHHPRYEPLAKVEDGAVKEMGIKCFGEDPTDVAWINPQTAAQNRDADLQAAEKAQED
ncbi:MAG: phytanoyl-CoA dioxygenase family protein [Candidatus Latescibacteria bacterium]|nr:phytanoyl-CoA dioxygenase family protein [Candidatus Latescibacterota bacterium]